MERTPRIALCHGTTKKRPFDVEKKTNQTVEHTKKKEEKKKKPTGLGGGGP